MRNLLYFTCLAIATCSCEREIIPAQLSCIKNSDEQFQSESHALLTTEEDQYFEFWKEHVIERSNITSEQFDQHFSEFYISSNESSRSISFRVDYKFKQGWIEFHTYDQVLVQFNDASTYPQHDFPRNELLNQEWMYYLIDNNIGFGINFTTVNLSENSVFDSCTEALKQARAISGYEKLEFSDVDFYAPGRAPRENGHPSARISGTVDREQNICLSGYMDLITGDLKVYESACIIIN